MKGDSEQSARATRIECARIASGMSTDSLAFEGVNVHYRQGWRDACAAIESVLVLRDGRPIVPGGTDDDA